VFAEAVAHGELLVNATNGAGSLDALRAAGEQNLEGKVLIDIANPLDVSGGMPPTLLTPIGSTTADGKPDVTLAHAEELQASRGPRWISARAHLPRGGSLS
jgi:hypothetical protein